MRIFLRWLAGFLLVCMPAAGALADQYHYNNVLIGDRAQGLGGAFTALGDDASGVFYNPAGLGFALSNDISGSGNAFYSRKVTYKKAVGDADFIEKSDGSMAPFLGGLQKLDKISPGLVFAFGILTKDSELKDQDDNIIAADIGALRFHRTANLRAETGGFSAAIAKRISSSFSVGMVLSYYTISELTQEYQDALQVYAEPGTAVQATDANGNGVFRLLTQNIRQKLDASIIEIGLGSQWALSHRLAVGITLKIPTIMSESYEYGIERTINYTVGNGDNLGSGTPATDYTGSDGTQGNIVYRTVADQLKEEKPLGSMPLETRIGLAYFATTRLLLTMDVVNYGEAKGDLELYEREPVTNFALGSEFYVTPPFPIRLGLFTNNDSPARANTLQSRILR